MTAAERYIEAQGTVGMISGLLLDPEVGAELDLLIKTAQRALAVGSVLHPSAFREGAEKLQEALSHALALRTAREQIAATMLPPSHAV